MKYIYCIISTLLLQTLFSQQKINDGWINVAGKSEKQIKKIIYQEINKQSTLALSFVEKQKNELEVSSEDKKIVKTWFHVKIDKGFSKPKHVFVRLSYEILAEFAPILVEK